MTKEKGMTLERWRLTYWLVVLFAASSLLVRIGSYPLTDPDEARFARVSVEMLRTGNLVIPTFKGEPHLAKPPLLYWIQATLFRMLGIGEFAARLPAALSTIGSLFLVGWIARRRFGEEGAAWACAIFFTMPLVFVEAHIGTLDALLSVHILAAVALDLAGPERAGAQRGIAIGALLGLAFLAKGPVGVALPALIILAGRTASGKSVIPSGRAALAALAAWSVVVLPWGLVFIESVGGGTALSTIRKEVLERYFAGDAHVAPPWYFAKIATVAFLPWLAPLVLGALRLAARRHDRMSRTAVYCAAGLLVGLLFFSLGKGKLPNYILPLAPLAALLVTWEFGQELSAPKERMLGPGLMAATMFLFAAGLGYSVAGGLFERGTFVMNVGTVVFGIGSVVAALGTLVARPRLVYGTAVVCTAGFLVAASFSLPSIIAEDRSSARLVEEIERYSFGRPVVLLESRLPGVTFYMDRAPEHLLCTQLEERLSRHDRPLLVIREVDLGAIPREIRPRLREISRVGKFVLLE